MSDRPDILKHDAGYFDGEQYVFDAQEIKGCIDWADQLEDDNEALREFENEDPVELLRLCAETLDDGNWHREIVLARANWLRRYASHIAHLREEVMGVTHGR
jgi:hypothetical protein